MAAELLALLQHQAAPQGGGGAIPQAEATALSAEGQQPGHGMELAMGVAELLAKQQ